MKKIISILLIIAMCIPFSACGDDPEAIAMAESALQNIKIAHDTAIKVDTDIQETIRIVTSDPEAYAKGGSTYLAESLNIPLDNLKEASGAMLYFLFEVEAASSSPAFDVVENLLLSAIKEDKLVEYATQTIHLAWSLEKHQSPVLDALDNAKKTIEELEVQFPEYSHYDALMNYYQTTDLYFSKMFSEDIVYGLNVLEEGCGHISELSSSLRNNCDTSYARLIEFFE